jgi:hypothetical protein
MKVDNAINMYEFAATVVEEISRHGIQVVLERWEGLPLSVAIMNADGEVSRQFLPGPDSPGCYDPVDFALYAIAMAAWGPEEL